MRTLLLTAILILSLMPAQAQEFPATGKVISVQDGDTFRLESGERIRLKRIDAYELPQPLGWTGKNFLQGFLLNQEVELTK
jgi:endonuclease YncB( thermonuclease family)